MAFHQILSEKELQIAPDGLYFVAGDDHGYIETEKDGAVYRLMARVRDLDELPKDVQGCVIRADGKQIVTVWEPAELAAEAKPAVVDTSVAVAEESNTYETDCPLCGSKLTNRVIRTVTVCPGCGRSIALMDGTATIATATHTLPLTAEEIRLLKADRPKVRA